MSNERLHHLGARIAQALEEATAHGMSVDEAITAQLGFAVGIVMNRYGWTPKEVGERAVVVAQRIAASRAAGDASPLIVVPR